MRDSRALPLAALVALVIVLTMSTLVHAQSRHRDEAARACLDPPPSDEVLVRGAVAWMLPHRTIDVADFETGNADGSPGAGARFAQAGSGLSLTPVSRSIAHSRAGDFSISATMTLAATLRADYATADGRRSCELMVEGPLAMKATVVVDRSDALEDRVRPLTVDQVNDSGLRLRGCSDIVARPAVVADVRDMLVELSATAVFVPACRPCAGTPFQACADP